MGLGGVCPHADLSPALGTVAISFGVCTCVLGNDRVREVVMAPRGAGCLVRRKGAVVLAVLVSFIRTRGAWEGPVRSCPSQV